ncbi:hypothetical protein PIB30_033289 [Stylosanthes scabra]|uniref:Uncharacterized protein n=1 Tax=Stylosanthes scabra TaxID=79078 RepID=A0ABU6RCQ4_9FABA|nr:hypothetical protein [Stylosanthes scabra]
METDLFQVRGLENSIVKTKICRNCSSQIEDSLKGVTQEKKWGDWLKSDHGGRRISISKKNMNPNFQHKKDNNSSKHNKSIPVNLIKSLASLSMHSRSKNHIRDDEEIISQATPIPNAPEVPLSTTVPQIPTNMTNDS